MYGDFSIHVWLTLKTINYKYFVIKINDNEIKKKNDKKKGQEGGLGGLFGPPRILVFSWFSWYY